MRSIWTDYYIQYEYFNGNNLNDFFRRLYDGICSLDHKFIQNDTLYSLEKDLRLNEFDRKYFESRNNTKEDDINVLAIACTRMCAFTC